jgi:hypothetical protein
MLNAEEYSDLRERMQSLNDEGLMRVVLLFQDQYKPEAISIAKDELRRRGLEGVTLEQLIEQTPEEYYNFVPDFCPGCIAETTDKSVGILFHFYNIGLYLLGNGSECDICGSVIQRIWFLFFIPIFPGSKYRVKYLEPGFSHGKLVSRRLK